MTRRRSERELDRAVDDLEPVGQLHPLQRKVRQMGAPRGIWADPVEALRWFNKKADGAEEDR